MKPQLCGEQQSASFYLCSDFRLTSTSCDVMMAKTRKCPLAILVILVEENPVTCEPSEQDVNNCSVMIQVNGLTMGH